MTAGKFLAIFLVLLGVLYSFLSHLARTSEIGAGMATCVFGGAILGGLLVAFILFARRK